MQISDEVSLSGRSNWVLQLLPARSPGKGHMNANNRVSSMHIPVDRSLSLPPMILERCAYSAPAVLCSNVVEVLYMGGCHRSRVTSYGVLMRSDPQD